MDLFRQEYNDSHPKDIPRSSSHWYAFSLPNVQIKSPCCMGVPVGNHMTDSWMQQNFHYDISKLMLNSHNYRKGTIVCV